MGALFGCDLWMGFTKSAKFETTQLCQLGLGTNQFTSSKAKGLKTLLLTVFFPIPYTFPHFFALNTIPRRSSKKIKKPTLKRSRLKKVEACLVSKRGFGKGSTRKVRFPHFLHFPPFLPHFFALKTTPRSRCPIWKRWGWRRFSSKEGYWISTKRVRFQAA